MKAMIFAAGIGSRLKPFTDSHPKALAPVAGVPAIQRVIEHLRDSGVKDVVVNVHHFASQVCNFLSDNQYFGLNIHISDETGSLLDTGGGLLKASQFLIDGSDEPLLLHNADIVSDLSLESMLHAHLQSGADATLLADDRRSTRQLYFDIHTHQLRGWANSATGETIPEGLELADLQGLSFGGIHIVSPTVFPFLKQYSDSTGRTVFSITPFYLASMSDLKICSYTPVEPYRWHDIGTPEKLDAATKAFA